MLDPESGPGVTRSGPENGSETVVPTDVGGVRVEGVTTDPRFVWG